jgi:thiol-disulfide isomerase/thioredoxin
MIAVVTVVGAVCLLDLLLTFGVIRRLREHTEMLASAGPAKPPAGLSTGELPGTFAAMTTEGDLVHGTTGLRVVAFFASWCTVCPERVPPFAAYLRTYQISRHSVLAVSAGPGDAPPAHLAELVGLAQICAEKDDGELAKAFKVTTFPTFYLLDADGAVTVKDHDPSVLPEPAFA